ncbi:C-type lectin domain family 12 member A-like [Hypanus sabinus]|uniref:C-type lectin domain family 12 member A-like n=1 Tax=Hypanus sabinus TaxID=79690 RepID=UPI0028C3DB2E|nr:C-type lectin domain family 12 member A-like [Hypanus sabinus]
MDESGTYEKMRFTGTDTQAPSGVGLSSTYAEVKFPNDEHVIDEDQVPPIAAGLRKLPTNAQPAAHEQHPKGKIGNRPDSLICLLCLVMSAFIVTVAGLSIHVSQIRQSKETSHRNYHQLNSSLQFKLSAVKSNLSDLRHQICELLTRSRDQPCSEDWVRKKDRCYYVSTFGTTFQEAIQDCSNRHSRLLEINSKDEALFVFGELVYKTHSYWNRKCENGNVGQSLLYKASDGSNVCSQCGRIYSCDRVWRFICEKTTALFPDIPEKIRGLCQKSAEAT